MTKFEPGDIVEITHNTLDKYDKRFIGFRAKVIRVNERDAYLRPLSSRPDNFNFSEFAWHTDGLKILIGKKVDITVRAEIVNSMGAYAYRITNGAYTLYPDDVINVVDVIEPMVGGDWYELDNGYTVYIMPNGEGAIWNKANGFYDFYDQEALSYHKFTLIDSPLED